MAAANAQRKEEQRIKEDGIAVRTPTNVSSVFSTLTIFPQNVHQTNLNKIHGEISLVESQLEEEKNIFEANVSRRVV